MISSSFNNVMKKLKIHLEKKYERNILDSDLAKQLNITKEHYSRCKTKGKIPLQAVIELCAKESIVINYILFDQFPESLDTATQNIISIKYFKNINTSAGGGALNESQEYELLTIDKDMVESLGGVNNLKFIEALNVLGESMEPIIEDNSIVFIDKNKINPSITKKEIYVVNTPNGVFVKWVSFIPKYNKIQLLSQNRLYSPELFDIDEVRILGKVIGVGEV